MTFRLQFTGNTERQWMDALMRAGGARLERKKGGIATGEWIESLRMDASARVVLVGNGPSALKSNLGPAIDAHDEVVRFNDGRITGYEPHVGTRTTLWVTSANQLASDPQMNRSRALQFNGETYHPNPHAGTVYRIQKHFYWTLTKQLRALVKDYPAEKIIPSCGLLAISYLLEIVGVKQLSLVGFDHFKRDDTKQHHYWVAAGFGRPLEHDGPAETVICQEFLKAGKITYL